MGHYVVEAQVNFNSTGQRNAAQTTVNDYIAAHPEVFEVVRHQRATINGAPGLDLVVKVTEDGYITVMTDIWNAFQSGGWKDTFDYSSGWRPDP